MIKILNLLSLWALPLIILIVFTYAIKVKVPVYEEFITGAKGGFKIAINIIPYLVAIIVGISMFRASGAIELIAQLFAPVLEFCHIPADVIPLTIVRSLSGSATLGVFSDIANSLDPNCYAVKLAAVMVGSSETTFYVLSVYFGAVKITKFRYAMLVGIMADIVGIISAILVCQMMFG